MDGVASVGTSTLWAHDDHRHPTDTSRASQSSIVTYTGTTAPNTYATKSAINTYTGTTAPNAYVSKTAFNTYSGTTIPANYYNKTQINSYTGATATAIGLKANIASPTFTGTVRSVTPATNDNSTCIATTAYYIGQCGTALPLINGTAAVGTSALWSHQDHVHPIDTSRLAVTAFNTYSGTTVPNTYATKSAINTYTGTTAPAAFSPLNSSICSVSTNTTIDATYSGKIIEATNTITITLPNGMATGMVVDIVNVGAGTITLAASTTLQSKSSRTKLASQYVGATAYHRGSNVWLATGDLTP